MKGNIESIQMYTIIEEGQYLSNYSAVYFFIIIGFTVDNSAVTHTQRRVSQIS